MGRIEEICSSEGNGTAVRFTCACTFWARARGLLGRTSYDGVLMLVPCHDIHTFGMRFPVDVVFAAEDGRVLEAHRSVPPGKRLRCRRASITLERAECAAPWFQQGDCLRLCE